MIEYVDSCNAYAKLLEKLSKSRWIALDTEFVSERRFQPWLCLVQLAWDGGMCLLDPLALPSLSEFWELLAEGNHETIVHAGRGDLEFCIRQTGKLPKKIFDTQLAAGFIGWAYPAGYANLLETSLGINLRNTETRTDWSRRPLMQQQIEYGLDDVRYLQPLRNMIGGRLEKLKRQEWYDFEMEEWKQSFFRQFGPDRWEKLVPNSSLDRRGLAIVRELYYWRERRARSANCPARRILRDDLILELARRRSSRQERIKELRELNQSNFVTVLPQIARVIDDALNMPQEDCPPLRPHDCSSKMTVLGQLMYSALGTVCKREELAVNLVGCPSDVRQWIVRRVRKDAPIRPSILEIGWRKQVVGALFDELLSGQLLIRVADIESEMPLEFLRPGENPK